MGDKAKVDGRSAYRGSEARVVAGGRRYNGTYVEEHLYQDLKTVAKAEGASISLTIGRAIAEYTAKRLKKIKAAA